MPRNHKPSKASQAFVQQNREKYSSPKHSHQCAKSPTGSHCWMIDPPDGGWSSGYCRYCGDKRQFANTMDVVFSAGWG